jgi:hypothetical protein
MKKFAQMTLTVVFGLGALAAFSNLGMAQEERKAAPGQQVIPTPKPPESDPAAQAAQVKLIIDGSVLEIKGMRFPKGGCPGHC